MSEDHGRNLTLGVVLVGVGVLFCLTVQDLWSIPPNAAPSGPYWVVAEVQQDGVVVAPGPVRVRVDLGDGDATNRAGGACYFFDLGFRTDTDFTRRRSARGAVRFGNSRMDMLPGTYPFKTRCGSGTQLTFETAIESVISQAERWVWDGTTLRVYGGDPRSDLYLVDLNDLDG